MQGGGDDGKGVAAARVSVGDIHHGLEVVCEGDCHGGVRAEAEATDAHDAGEKVGTTEAEALPAAGSEGAPEGRSRLGAGGAEAPRRNKSRSAVASGGRAVLV